MKSLAVILLILLMLLLTGCVTISKYEALETKCQELEGKYQRCDEELQFSFAHNRVLKEQSQWCAWLTLDYPQGICGENATHIAICSGKDFPLCDKHAGEVEKLNYKVVPLKND